MSVHTYKHIWTSQPQTPTKVRQAFSKNIVFAYNAAAGDLNLVDGRLAGAIGSGVTKSPKQQGVARVFDGTQANGALSWGTTYNPLQGSSGLTVVITYFQTNASIERKLFCKWGTAPYGFLLGVASSSYPYLAVGISSTQIEAYRSNVFTGVVGSEQTLVARWDGTNGEGGYRFFIDGVKSGTSVLIYDDGNPSVIPTTTNDNFQIGRDSSAGGNPFLGHIYQVTAFYGGLTDQECIALSLNHNLVYQPIERRIWGPSAGGSSVSVTGSGGMTFAGSATVSRVVSHSGSGGVTFAGSADVIRKVAPSVSGGMIFAGAASVSRGLQVSGSGGMVFAGEGTVSRVAAPTAGGTLSFAGAADVSSNGTNSVSVTGSGGMTFAGGATVSAVRVSQVSGGLTFNGAATVSTHTSTASAVGSGGITFAGTATAYGISIDSVRQRTMVGTGV